MLPWQQPASFAPSSDIGSPLLPIEEELVAALAYEEFLFHGNETQRNDGGATCSSVEEQIMMSTIPDCNYWPDHGFTHVGDDNAEFECSLSFLEDLVEPTSQSQTFNHDASSSACTPAHLHSDSYGIAPTNTNTPLVQPSPVSEASSVGAYQHESHVPYINNHLHEHHSIKMCTHAKSSDFMLTSSLPHFFSGETSGTSFIHPSPVYSEASSFAAANEHDSFSMSSHSNDHLSIHMGMHLNAPNSVPVSISPNFRHGHVCMTDSGSLASTIASSNDDFFDNEATSLVALASPKSYDLNLAIAEGRASQSQLNLEARGSPYHEASSYGMNAAGSPRNPNSCEATKTDNVAFFVKSDTPTIEDGYVWRKYGQKNIKDRLHPRSYYRCAQPNCFVKKQTESSSEEQGFVIITYFGKHNHQNNL